MASYTKHGLEIAVTATFNNNLEKSLCMHSKLSTWYQTLNKFLEKSR